MTERITALLVHQNSETLAALASTLERQGIRILHAASRAQAQRLLGGLTPPPIVFTDTELPDGTWADILAAADKAAQPVNVIVVARVVNTRFYVAAIETGAYDYVAPPFNATDMAYVVRGAYHNVISRRTQSAVEETAAEEDIFVEVQEAEAQANLG